MIDSIGSVAPNAPGLNAMGMKHTPLTEDEKTTLTDILSKYDAENMSEADTKSLMDELRSSGIKPSREVRGIIEDAGFELGKPPERAEGPGKGGRPPRPDFIQEAIDKYESGELTEENINTLMTKLMQYGEQPQGILFDQEG